MVEFRARRFEPAAFPPRLETPRLLLRPLDEGDVDAVFAYASNPNVARYTLWQTHRHREESLRFITDYALPNYRRRVPDPFGLVSRQGRRALLGTAGCFWASREHKTMELGFALAEEAWGQGYATEASRAILGWAFTTFKPHRMQARCHVDNLASARVLEKLGMQREGTLRGAVQVAGVAWDVALFAVLAPEWRKRSQREGA